MRSGQAELIDTRSAWHATESSGEIDKRIAYAQEQKELAGQFDYVVENDDRARAADECVAIVAQVLANPATMARR